MREDVEKATHSMLGTLSPMNNQYGGMYRGTVLNNDDPKHRGRCKIFIPGVYNDEFADEDGKYLPWAEPSQPLFCGGIEKNGTFQCPDLGSTVWCFFESNDTARPVFFGQTTDAQGYFDTDHCRLLWDGMYVEFEKSTHTITTSAMYVKGTASIDMSGHADKDCYMDCGKNATVNVGADANVTATGNIRVSAGSLVDIFAASEAIITAPVVTINGNVTINGTAHITGETTIDASENVGSDAVIGGKSFLGHIHGNGNLGLPTTPPIA